MGNLGLTLVKIGLLAGGAVVGALLSHLFDEALLKHAEEQSQHDKTRYAQGLTPVQPTPTNL